jgi:short-subunit dehydrogenase
MKTKETYALTAAGVALAGWALSHSIPPRFSFAGKVCVVTGGSRGLGLVMARQICAAGGRVALIARDMSELRRAHDELVQSGADVCIVPCDLLDRGQIEEAVPGCRQPLWRD